MILNVGQQLWNKGTKYEKKNPNTNKNKYTFRFVHNYMLYVFELNLNCPLIYFLLFEAKPIVL